MAQTRKDPNPQADKENSTPPSSAASPAPANLKRKSGRLQHMNDRTNNRSDNHTENSAKRRKHAENQNAHKEQELADADVEQSGESQNIAKLKELLHDVRAQRDAAERKLLSLSASEETGAGNEGPADGSVSRPRHLHAVKMADIRRDLDLEGDEHAAEWSRIRNAVRDAMRAGRIEWKLNWKEQKSGKLGKIYAAIEEDIPALRRFQNNWATELLVKQAFTSHKSYESCKDRPDSYRGKFKRFRRKARSSRRSASLESESSDLSSSSSSSESDNHHSSAPPSPPEDEASNL